MTTEPRAPLSVDPQASEGLLVAKRFQIIRVLGSGGMATVYAVLDRYTHKQLALKRCHALSDPHRQRRMLELLEREFYTLSQISHPCIVEAYDYGVDEQGAYYTMELLEGGDLQSQAPMPHKRACQIARDVCSALSLLHSRRLVYRDLNPRNVHSTLYGTSKLIDFGTITSMGPCMQVIGTPAYCAPEAVELQPLDARTDLYSLGATLYFLLTGQHAYPAKTFAQLRQVWAQLPPRPSAIAHDVPAAFDGVVMQLLSLDPASRPANAAEVIDQLGAILGRTSDEQNQVMQAYLSTPILVGRETQLNLVRSKLRRASRGHGSSILLTSDSGSGRSRLLATCLLEAKVLGALALSVAPSESDDYATLRALSRALFDAAPELAARTASAHRETLAGIITTQHDAAAESLPAPTSDRPKLLAAVRDWFAEVARERPLLIAVDDFHRVDEPSAACLARIAYDANAFPFLFLVAREAGASALAPAAVKLLEGIATHVPIENLTAVQTEELLGSVFGRVPNVQMVAHKLHAIAAGNPRDIMRLAQNMLDRGVARYRWGTWTLPASFDDGQLPLSMTEALRAEFEALPNPARELARVLSLAKDRALSFDECVAVFSELPAKSVHDSLQELVRTQFATLAAELFTIAHSAIHATVQSGMGPEQLATAHRKIAEAYLRRDNEPFRLAKHLLLAGDTARGIEVLIAFAIASQQRTDHDPNEYVKLVRSMPDDWLEVFSQAIQGCERLERPRTEVFRLRHRLNSLLNVLGAPLAASRAHMLASINQLCEDSGLDAYNALDATLEPTARLTQALTAAKHRYDTSLENTRGLDPQSAIGWLVRTELTAAGIVAIAIDHGFWTALPSVGPFAKLSPAIAVIDKLVRAVGARVSGRYEFARNAYHEIIDRTGQPDLAGLDASNHRFLRYGVLYGLAVMEASMGLASCRALAQTLSSEPLHEVNALQVEMLHDFWLGRIREADACRERVELRRIESSVRQMADGTHLLWQAVAHAYADDLTHIKQVIEEMAPLAKRHPGWARVVAYATGEYHRIRGDFPAAAEHLRAALDDTDAGTHQIWANAAGTYLSVLCSLGKLDEAVTLGTSYVAAAERTELGYTSDYIRMPLAVALARTGDGERAALLADGVIERFIALGTEGLNLFLAYEARTRVAMHSKNVADFERFARECAEHSRKAGGRALRAKYDRLEWAAKASSLVPPSAAAAPVGASLLETALKSAFSECDQPRVRAERSLQFLLSASGSSEGALYLIGDHGTAQAARIGEADSAHDLATAVLEFIDSELEEGGLITKSLDAELGSTALKSQFGLYMFVLLSHQTPNGIAITGAAALQLKSGTAFAHPGSLASRLSRMLADSGDVVPLSGE